MEFIIADFHFGHDGILRHCNRPFATVEEMDEAIIENANAVVGKKDTLRIIGDFAFQDHAKYLSRLNGKKILITGNHDKMSQEVMKNFTDVRDFDYRKIEGKWIFFSHYPMRTWQNSHFGSWHLFGHVHNRMATMNLSMDVGIDTFLAKKRAVNPKIGAPIPFEDICESMKARHEQMRISGRIIEENGKRMYRQDDVAYLMSKMGNR